MLRKIRFLRDEDDGKEYKLPEGYEFFNDCCYEDGSPVLFKWGEPFIIKVGKRRWGKIIMEKNNAFY